MPDNSTTALAMRSTGIHDGVCGIVSIYMRIDKGVNLDELTSSSAGNAPSVLTLWIINGIASVVFHKPCVESPTI